MGLLHRLSEILKGKFIGGELSDKQAYEQMIKAVRPHLGLTGIQVLGKAIQGRCWRERRKLCPRLRRSTPRRLVSVGTELSHSCRTRSNLPLSASSASCTLRNRKRIDRRSWALFRLTYARNGDM